MFEAKPKCKDDHQSSKTNTKHKTEVLEFDLILHSVIGCFSKTLGLHCKYLCPKDNDGGKCKESLHSANTSCTLSKIWVLFSKVDAPKRLAFGRFVTTLYDSLGGDNVKKLPFYNNV